MIKKILAANRGETAVRIFRACRAISISTAAVYTNVDRRALHVRHTEEVYCISSSPEDTPYLKPELILSITKKTGAVIHLGYELSLENADFAHRCKGERVIFIGSGANIIARMGIKAEARKIMREAGLPIVPGTGTPVQGTKEVKKAAKEVGYPIMLKMLAGGDGERMRLIRSEKGVETVLRLFQSEAGVSFGNDAVYIEKYIESLHHIEVQIMGDKYGNVVHLGERECSTQRRNQRVIEEFSSPFMRGETCKKMPKVAVETCKRIGYYSVGTPEFTMNKDQNFCFLEMNTRLWVEHPVMEECTGVDLVHDMVMVATDNPLPYKQENIKFSRATTKCRIYAEDSESNSMPSPGVIAVREAPEDRNLRLDNTAHTGFEVSLYYDPMIAKLCCWRRTRESVISNMAYALCEYKTLGVKTAIPFHQRVLKNAALPEGKCDTTFIDTCSDKEDLKRRQNTDPTAVMVTVAARHYKRGEEVVSHATTLPVVGESLRKYYDELQMAASNY